MKCDDFAMIINNLVLFLNLKYVIIYKYMYGVSCFINGVTLHTTVVLQVYDNILA